MSWQLKGKVVVVTGGAAGIGAAAVRELARRGAQVAILDVDEGAAQALASELGPPALAVRVDVSERASVEAAIETVRTALGGIDVVVANAGISGPARPVLTVDSDAVERVLAINLMGTWHTIKSGLPDVVARNGYVVAVSSMAAGLPGPGMAGYSMSKVAIDALGRALRIELASTGTDVGVAYFGPVETDLIHSGQGPTFSDIMGSFPGPMRRPISAQDAAIALVDGIERRSGRIYAPGWVRALLGFRGQLVVFDRYLNRFPSVAAVIGDQR